MSPMAMHITTWLASSSQGAATTRSTDTYGRTWADPVPCASPSTAPTRAYSGTCVPWWEAPLLCEARVKMADAKKANAEQGPNPGSSRHPAGLDVAIDDADRWVASPGKAAYGLSYHQQ